MQCFERFGEGNGMPSKDDVAKYGVPGNIVWGGGGGGGGGGDPWRKNNGDFEKIKKAIRTKFIEKGSIKYQPMMQVSKKREASNTNR